MEGSLELLSPRAIKDWTHRHRLDEAGVRGGWNYHLDHAWLYREIDEYVKARPEETPIILDVGCGNSALHTFLEPELHLGVVGIDRIWGKCPYEERDIRMDLCIDFRTANTFFNGTADIVYWCSAIEHNEVEEQKACVAESLRALKPGGIFLATFGFAPQTSWFEDSQQWNLSASDAEDVFGVEWSSEPSFDAMVEEYRDDIFDIDTRHKKRYETDDYAFVVAAAKIVKG
jgi:SAM-dependent methyltransferase